MKALGSETLLRLTQHPSEWISPAWSPDGTQIAFHRMAGADTGIYVVPALGGPERKLRSTRMPWADCNYQLDYQLVAGRQVDRLRRCVARRRNMQGSISSQRKHWRPSRFQSVQCALVKVCQRSPTTASISHTGVFDSDDEAVLYSLPLPGGQPKMIASFRAFPTGLTWSADDKKLIYSLILEWDAQTNSAKLLSRMAR